MLAWASVTVAGQGRTVEGTITQPHVRPWSTAMRIPTDAGDVWLKASGPGPAHEGPLLLVFRDLGARHVLLPLAVHPDRPWILTEDGGSTLRATRPDMTGDHDLAAWERILREYAALQRSLEGPAATAAMLAAGAPDGRPDRLAGAFARLLDDDAIWARVAPDERVAAVTARRRLRAAAGDVGRRAADLAASGVAATIQHDDLHSNNVLVGPLGDRFFDWGDAVVAHPFGTLTTTFNSISNKTGLALDDPVFERLRDVYLEAWTGVLPRAALIELSVLARDLACIGKALAWERALQGLEPGEMEGFGDGVAGWLMEFAERLAAPAPR